MNENNYVMHVSENVGKSVINFVNNGDFECIMIDEFDSVGLELNQKEKDCIKELCSTLGISIYEAIKIMKLQNDFKSVMEIPEHNYKSKPWKKKRFWE